MWLFDASAAGTQNTPRRGMPTVYKPCVQRMKHVASRVCAEPRKGTRDVVHWALLPPMTFD